ncbi:MAG: hypothetical protein CFE25_14205 [Chitinophagaceae bacterium BSSC1]|nr:MAG: hypothetical protein CFE25_14205 [Chitinophagaceae bacterium BSSC1]
MNIVNRFFLNMVMLPTSIYERMGVDTTQLKSILKIKLAMDDRRPSSFQQNRAQKNKKPIKLATLGTMVLTLLMGSFFLFSFFVGNDDVTKGTIYFSMYIFMLAATLISDFTSVLIDVRDNMIILPKPVSDRTFLLSRLLHIVVHISKLILPMTLPAMILIGINRGIGGVSSFAFLVFLATLFTIFLINALYIFILRVTTPERFKTIISYFQIFIAIMFYASYQLVPRLINKAVIENFRVGQSTWIWLTPPYWFANAWNLLNNADFSMGAIISMVLSIAIPIASIWVVIKYFAPNFNRKLSMISGSEGGAAPLPKNGKIIRSTTSIYLSLVSKWFSRKGAERMAFLLTYKITSRSREFKMKVYPSMGYLVVYLVMIFFTNKKISVSDLSYGNTSSKILFISLIYFSSFILIMASGQIQYSDKFKAAWIYFTTPIKEPGMLISGAIRAMIVKFYLPLISTITILSIVFMGPAIIPNLVLGCANQLFITAMVGYISIRELPFSHAQDQVKINFIRGLFTFLIPVSVAGLHYLVYSFMPVVIILSVLVIIAYWMVMDSIRKKSWVNIITTYED